MKIKLHMIIWTLESWDSAVKTVNYRQTKSFVSLITIYRWMLLIIWNQNTFFFHYCNKSFRFIYYLIRLIIYMIVEVNLNIFKKSPGKWFDVPFKIKYFSWFDVFFCHVLLTINVVRIILITGTSNPVKERRIGCYNGVLFIHVHIWNVMGFLVVMVEVGGGGVWRGTFFVCAIDGKVRYPCIIVWKKKPPNFKGVDQRVVTNYSVSIKRAITGVHAFKGIKNNSTVSCTSAF